MGSVFQVRYFYSNQNDKMESCGKCLWLAENTVNPQDMVEHFVEQHQGNVKLLLVEDLKERTIVHLSGLELCYIENPAFIKKVRTVVK